MLDSSLKKQITFVNKDVIWVDHVQCYIENVEYEIVNGKLFISITYSNPECKKQHTKSFLMSDKVHFG